MGLQRGAKKGFKNPNMPGKEEVKNYLQTDKAAEEIVNHFHISFNELNRLMDSISDELCIYEYRGTYNGKLEVFYGILKAS